MEGIEVHKLVIHIDRATQVIADFIVIIIFFIIFAFVYGLQPPRIAYFTCNDSNELSYPFINDTIPFWAVVLYATLGTLILIALVEIKNARFVAKKTDDLRSIRQRLKDFLICLYHPISLFCLGIAITLLLTEIGKRWVGRLRPHFLTICQPWFYNINCTTSALNGVLYNSIYTGGSFCHGDPNKVQEARFSWPSGHSSYSWFCMSYLFIYLQIRLRLLRLRYVKAILQSTAIIAAFVTSISRILDYHHRPTEVLSGSILGILVALFVTLVLGRVLFVLDERPRKHEISSARSVDPADYF